MHNFKPSNVWMYSAKVKPMYTNTYYRTKVMSSAKIISRWKMLAIYVVELLWLKAVLSYSRTVSNSFVMVTITWQLFGAVFNYVSMLRMYNALSSFIVLVAKPIRVKLPDNTKSECRVHVIMRSRLYTYRKLVRACMTWLSTPGNNMH